MARKANDKDGEGKNMGTFHPCPLTSGHVIVTAWESKRCPSPGTPGAAFWPRGGGHGP